MTVVAAEVRVGHQRRFQIPGILPRQIQRRRKGIVQIARRTQHLPDHRLIGTRRPLLHLLSSDPLRAELLDRIPHTFAAKYGQQHFGQIPRGGFNHFPSVRHPHLLPHRRQRRRLIVSIPRRQHRHMRQAADVDISAATLFRLLSPRIVGEKIPVTLFDIRVPMPPLRGHELDIPPQIICTVIPAAMAQRIE